MKKKQKPSLSITILLSVFIQFYLGCLFVFRLSKVIVGVITFLECFQLLCISSSPLWYLTSVSRKTCLWVYSSQCEYLTCCIENIGHIILYAATISTNFKVVRKNSEQQGRGNEADMKTDVREMNTSSQIIFFVSACVCVCVLFFPSTWLWDWGAVWGLC